MSINNFDVMKAMCEANGKIQIAPLKNILNMRKTKRGTLVTIGIHGDFFGGDVLMGLLEGNYIGGLILCDKAEFENTARAIEVQAIRDS
jgi:hypothetical protein